MAPPLRVRLDQAAHDELDRRYQTTRDATTRTRYQMILLRAEGHRVPEVAQLTRCSPDTVRRVLKRYLAGGRTRCRTGPIWASRPTTRPPGSRSWSGWPTATPTRLGWTARVELSAAGRLPGRGDRAPGGDRVGAGRAAPRGVCVQAAPLGASPQGAGAAGVGKNACGWRRCLPGPQQRCLHPQPAWSRMRPWPRSWSRRSCRACWACSAVRTGTCKTRSRSPCTRP